jgi:hypothetical protein
LDQFLPGAHIFLGHIAEDEDSLDVAIRHYENYLKERPSGERAKEIARRIELIRWVKGRRIARGLLGREADLDPNSFGEWTVGVLRFNSARLPESLRPLGKGLADLLSADLAKVGALQVARQTEVEALWSELNLAASLPIDSSAALRTGTLLGVRTVIFGGISEVSEGRLLVEPALVRTGTAISEAGKEQSGELAQFFQMEKRIVWDILRKLGIEPSMEEKYALDQTPTESFVAFLSYSRGLEHQDHGRFDSARREYERACQVDPAFAEAGRRAREMEYLSALDLGDGLEPLDKYVTRYTNRSEWTERPARTDERLSGLVENAGFNRPLGSTIGADDPFTPPSANTRVIIEGDFDP